MMTEDELKQLDEKVKTFGKFDKDLSKFRDELWKLADKYGVDGATIFKEYMDWRSSKGNS